MTVQTALLQGTTLLEEAGIAVPRLTAEVLLAHALRRERVYLFAHPEHELAEVEWIHYGRYLHERLKGKPTQYITKRQEFYGREFRVTPDVLIPRPETEHVVEVAVPKGAPARAGRRDGSGALAVTLQLETGAEVWATDISPAAAARGCGECADGSGRASDVRRLRPDGGGRAGLDGPDRLEPAVRAAVAARGPAARSARLRAARRAVRRRERVRAVRPDRGRRAAGAAPRRLAGDGTGVRVREHVAGVAARVGRGAVEPDLAGIPRVIAASSASSLCRNAWKH